MTNAKYVQLATEFMTMCSKSAKTFMKPFGTIRVCMVLKELPAICDDVIALFWAQPLLIEPGRVLVELLVTEDMANPKGTLHGGCLTTLVDVSTTMAGISLRGTPGVSTDMHVSFIGPAPVGSTVLMDSVIMKSGKNLVYAKADLYLKEGSKPVATALHTLIYPQPKGNQ